MPGLDSFIAEYGIAAMFGAVFALAAAGLVKGVIGFALPLIALSIMGSFLPIELAVAFLILPSLVANTLQGLRNGTSAAFASIRKFWRLNLIMIVTIAFVAQLLRILPQNFLFGLLGILTVAFGMSQLLGWKPVIPKSKMRRTECFVGLFSGFTGGLSGIWGPPIVIFLLAAGTKKIEMVRTQALSFAFGSIVLTGAHLKSGVLNVTTLPVSAWLVVPTMVAMLLGYKIQDRLDQELFRKLTLIVLVLAGLNMLRRAYWG